MKSKVISLSIAAFFLMAILSIITSALIIRSIDITPLSPGGSSEIRIVVDNDADEDIRDVSMALDLTNTPLTSIGSSEDVLDEIEEDEDGVFIFNLRANNNAEPGNYNVPYILTYRNATQPRKGTLGVLISGNTNLEFAANVENPIVGREGGLDLKIINKGTADARFVNLEIFPSGYTLLSEKKIYIGTVSADDFESISIDAIFNKRGAKLQGVIEYVDFDNNLVIKNIDIPLTLYTQEEAIEKGIIKKSNTGLYIGIVVALIIIWIIWRIIARRSRRKRSMQKERSP